MKEQFRRAISLYFNSFLWPTLVFLALGTAFVFTAVLSQWLPLMLLLNAILLGMLLALVGILAASIWNLIKKRWRKRAQTAGRGL
jgi:Na+-transporting methylmalonyl-CoA/oxaloacetate decarboxylase beta subunit